MPAVFKDDVMLFEARSYQAEAVQSLWSYFTENTGNPLIVMPTGTGKSIVIALFLQEVYAQFPNQRIMVLTHVKELIGQNHDKLLKLWPYAPAGIYSAGLKKKESNAPITFAGIASVAKKANMFGHVDLVIIDEAHLVSTSQTTMYRKFLNGLEEINPHVKVIGLTATPYRLGHGQLTDPSTVGGKVTPSLFTDICFDISGVQAFNRLIAEGYLAPLIPRSTRMKLDVDGVHMRGGEYVQGELQIAVDKEEITAAACREAIELGHNRNHWLVFCAGVDHTKNTCDILNYLGVPAVAIHSKMPDAERDDAIAQFKAGKVRAAVNNNVLTTGFDFQALDMILCLRPTASAGLWVQMLGRGTRPYPGKENCLVLDFANNTRRLGPINDPVTPRRKGEKVGEAPVKECPVCQCWVHASLRWCDGFLANGDKCTYEFTFQTKLKNESSTETLIKGDLPIVEMFKVDHITFSLHEKEGKPPAMKVAYYCGFHAFYEYICIEHEGYAGKKARDWWRARTMGPLPKTTDEALCWASTLPPATHLRVWINKQFPDILATCFDGTAFGSTPASGFQPEVETDALYDIPF